MNEIIVALIAAGGSVFVGVLSFVGVIISNSKSNKEMQNKMSIQQAVTEEKITELTREVREHNGFARRMPVVEEQIKVVNHRIKNIEDEIHDIKAERG